MTLLERWEQKVEKLRVVGCGRGPSMVAVMELYGTRIKSQMEPTE